ncbi:MAG: fibronectin type III domain-containing protein [Bryobacteraceae bacterium]
MPPLLTATRGVSLLRSLSGLAVAQTTAANPCDLNNDNAVDVLDLPTAIVMRLGKLPCKANIAGPNACNDTVVERVRAAALGGVCATNRTVVLTWTASTSGNVTGYNIYRGDKSGGPYTMVNSSVVPSTTYTDAAVEPGKTYCYSATAVDNGNNESVYSNQSEAVIPGPVR